jgi:uncharacterized protein
LTFDRKILLGTIGTACARHRWITVVVFILLTALAGFYASKLEVNLGILALFERDDPEMAKVYYANENFGGMDYTFVAISADTIYDAKKLTDELAASYAASPMVLRVVEKVEADALMKYGFLFLEPEAIDDFHSYVQDNQADLVELFKDVHTVPFLNGFNRMLERQIIEQDEIGDPEDALARLDAFGNFLDTLDQYLTQGERLGAYGLKNSLRDLFLPSNSDDEGFSSVKDEYVVSPDGDTVMMLVMPSEAGDDFEFTSRMMTFMESEAARLGAKYPGAHVDVAGNVAITRDQYHAIQRDMRLSTIVTAILVLIIFFYFFRKFSDLALIAISLGVGVVWAFAVTYFYVGFLSIFTAFFSAILLGLGIDFAIHILARYGEIREQNPTMPVPEAIGAATSGAGPGVLTGAMTTACAFYVLLICRFEGIAQLGFVAGTGILSMMIVMFTLLPALLAIRDDRKNAKPVHQNREYFSLAPLATFMVKHRKPAAVVILAVTVVMAIAASKVKFNYDFRSLEPRNGTAREANLRLEAKFGKSIDYGLVFADSVELSREAAKGLKTRSTIGEVRSISDFIPLDQDQKIPHIKAIEPLLEPISVEKTVDASSTVTAESMNDWADTVRESRRMVLAVKQLAIVGGNFDVEDKCTKVMATADALAKRIETEKSGLTKGASYYQKTLGDELGGLLGNLKAAAGGERLTVEKLPEVVRNNFIGDDGKYLVYAYPNDYLWTQEMLEKNRADLRAVSPDSTSIGLAFMALLDKIKADFKTSIWVALGIVFLLVLLDFRKPVTAMMALVPLVMGAVWMVGSMVLLGMSFNLVNVAVVPLIIGIGIDNGVHILHRYRSENKDKIKMAVEHTGRAIFLSSITTMAGFGSLGLASYIAVATLGWVLVIGVIYCLFTSVVVLPILLSLIEPKVGRI